MSVGDFLTFLIILIFNHLPMEIYKLIIKEIIIMKLYAIIVCNIVRYCTYLYAINLIMIETHD